MCQFSVILSTGHYEAKKIGNMMHNLKVHAPSPNFTQNTYTVNMPNV